VNQQVGHVFGSLSILAKIKAGHQGVKPGRWYGWVAFAVVRHIRGVTQLPKFTCERLAEIGTAFY